ncbi:hypothetical protein SBOR_5514 [Sclerotinia borealis F-4128]|uniref:Uncharacterized protein n=1 Tax=Sclerotinia borealis (strain F-4128) TaxID=1432307 RepID=W9CH71_SCLBF|nr:hypothetical protein SBOR_5514 [Sclerotinia borealis F-4128]
MNPERQVPVCGNCQMASSHLSKTIGLGISRGMTKIGERVLSSDSAGYNIPLNVTNDKRLMREPLTTSDDELQSGTMILITIFENFQEEGSKDTKKGGGEGVEIMAET